MPQNPFQRRFSIVPQPTETTCGPTCLHAIYQHFSDSISLDSVIADIPENEDGGTYSVMLANHALRRGYTATIFSYNLRVFDPTWADLYREVLIEKLKARQVKASSKREIANIDAYCEFLSLGGNVRFEELTTGLMSKLLLDQNPVIAGLNSTHLYRNARIGKDGENDDVYGQMEGHFVTLFGYESSTDQVLVADPYHNNPLSDSLFYAIETQRLINAIMLGIVTYDANLLVIKRPVS